MKVHVALPTLNLTLNASSDVGAGALNHLEIQVASTAASATADCCAETCCHG